MVKDLYNLGRAVGFAAAGRAAASAPVQGPGAVVRAAGSGMGTADEEAFAHYLAQQGKYVETRFGLEGVDFLVEGAEWELKTMNSAGSNTMFNALVGAVEQNGATRVIVDGRRFGYTDEFVEKQMNRLWGRGHHPEEVLILSKDTIYVYKLYAPGP